MEVFIWIAAPACLAFMIAGAISWNLKTAVRWGVFCGLLPIAAVFVVFVLTSARLIGY